MLRLSLLSMFLLTMLAGCGEVIVFGHVVREGSPSSKSAPEAAPATPAAQTAPETAAVTSAAQPAAPAAPTQTSAALIAKAPATAHVVKAVNLTLTPEAAGKVAGDSRFATAALLEAIRAELRSRKLLDEQDAHASGTAEVLIDEVGMRPTVNAVVFGYQMMAGTLSGDLRLADAGGNALPDSRIVAESRLTIAADGTDKNPLGPLYHRFAVLTGDRLAGVPSKPNEVAADNMPRN